MKTFKMEDMTRGWFVGDFEPTAFATEHCEVAYKVYKANDKEQLHYHKVATEITVIVKGRVKMNGEEFSSGDVIVVEPYEQVLFEVLEDTINIVAKVPGASNDKYVVEE